ncbi:hypothetical protein J132_01814, partial [Termitomyces sp. J132]
LMSWYYSSKNLSLGALDCLVYNVILAPDFQCEDLEGFSAVQENRCLDDEASDHLPETSESLPWLSSDVWRKSSVFLPLPFTHKSYKSEKHAPTIQICFYHRDLVEVIKSRAMDFAAKWFHWHGFQLYWKPSENKPKQCVYGKVYTSDEFLELEKTITPVEGCNLEQVVLPLIFYLDSTHLANFGTASLWLVYMWFGNLSKYIHGKVGSFSAHHLAYLPSNAFSQLLLPNDQNYFDLFVRDPMHEFELGVWRTVFEHLIQMLHTYSPEPLAELDQRYHQILPFGHSTIHDQAIEEGAVDEWSAAVVSGAAAFASSHRDMLPSYDSLELVDSITETSTQSQTMRPSSVENEFGASQHIHQEGSSQSQIASPDCERSLSFLLF